MTWCSVDVRTPADERAAVTAWLVGRTGQAVEEREDGTLVSAAEDVLAADTLLRELRVRFGAAVEVSTRALPAIDWRVHWKDGLGPRRIGRLLLAPSWSPLGAVERSDRRTPTVIIDPQTAFGTGEHGSTRSALALLDRALQPGARVLDLGSGSGILAIAAAKLGASRATGVELDPEDEPVARANAERNGVADRVRFVTGDAALLAPLLGPVELVLSNILRSRNVALLEPIRAALGPGGSAIFAGMEHSERGLFMPTLEERGFVVRDEAVDESWWGVTARMR